MQMQNGFAGSKKPCEALMRLFCKQVDSWDILHPPILCSACDKLKCGDYKYLVMSASCKYPSCTFL